MFFFCKGSALQLRKTPVDVRALLFSCPLISPLPVDPMGAPIPESSSVRHAFLSSGRAIAPLDLFHFHFSSCTVFYVGDFPPLSPSKGRVNPDGRPPLTPLPVLLFRSSAIPRDFGISPGRQTSPAFPPDQSTPTEATQDVTVSFC